MAAAELSQVAIDFAKYVRFSCLSLGTLADRCSSLSLDEVPTRLRCVHCNRMALYASKLPCCDQNMCDNCKFILFSDAHTYTFMLTIFIGRTSLSTKCPVCFHEPIDKNDFRPNKTLRLTIRQWLAREEKRRQDLAGNAAATSATPETPAPAATPVIASTERIAETARSTNEEAAQPAGMTQEEQNEVSLSLHADARAAFLRRAIRPRFQFLKRKTNISIQAAGDSEGQSRSIETSAQHSFQSTETLPIQEQRAKSAEKDGNDHGGEAQQQTGQAGQDTVNGRQNYHAPNTGMALNIPNSQNFTHMYAGSFGQDPSQVGYQGMDWNNTGMFNPMMQMQMQNGGWGSYPNMMGKTSSNFLILLC